VGRAEGEGEEEGTICLSSRVRLRLIDGRDDDERGGGRDQAILGPSLHARKGQDR
jgi:hypothetical protein